MFLLQPFYLIAYYPPRVDEVIAFTVPNRMARSIADFAKKIIRFMPRTPPPLKTAFKKCREREFFYLHEVEKI